MNGIITIGYTATLCFIGSIAHFALTIMLRRFKVSREAPASHAHLSVEERQQKIRTASWISFAMGSLMLAAAFVFAWLERSK